jgi:L-threonylcarbamoyladenylate synthase
VKHYAPKARLIVLDWLDEADLASKIQQVRGRASAIHIISHTKVPHGVAANRIAMIPHDPEAFARAIYGELHRCDEAGADLILVEALPDGPEWQAIADRLRRAST